MKGLLAIPLLMLSACAGADQHPSGVELTFWARDGAATDPRVINVADHCCCSGQVATARLITMPSQDDPALEPELVLEISPLHRVIQRWAMPVDRIVVAVTDDTIIVPVAGTEIGAEAVYISSGGTINSGVVADSSTMGVLMECPYLPEFEDSAYVRCLSFRDLKTGQERMLAYQGPCT